MRVSKSKGSISTGSTKPHQQIEGDFGVVTFSCSLSPAKILWLTVVVSTCIKLLLIPSYRSTDFDVHRNWKSITYQLPIGDWYFDNQNGATVHTLDYPPTFAYFEAFWSNNSFTSILLNSRYLDTRCLERLPDDDNQVSRRCIIFQRLTVILADLVYIGGAWLFSYAIVAAQTNPFQWEKHAISFILMLLNTGMLFLDHVHFQYNGFMLGILLLSMAFMTLAVNSKMQSQRDTLHLLGAFFFALLLGFKHLYLTLAPIYFIYLLKNYCLAVDDSTKTSEFFRRLFKLGSITFFTLVAPYIPFLLQEDPILQLRQIVIRLFPFGRGLVHSYWAGNAWAILLGAHKILSFTNNLLARMSPTASSLTNIILSADPKQVPPSVCLLLVLLSMTPVLIKAFKLPGMHPNETTMSLFFSNAVVFCSFCSFIFGYHVHEKAIMTVIIPLTPLAIISYEHSTLYFRTIIFGHLGLLPLLFRPFESAFKLSCFLAFVCMTQLLLKYSHMYNRNNSVKRKLFGSGTWDYAAFGSVMVLLFFTEILYPLLFKQHSRMQFLPLMMTSMLCASGLIGCWIQSGLIVS